MVSARGLTAGSVRQLGRQASMHRALDGAQVEQGQQEEEQLAELMPHQLAVEVLEAQSPRHAWLAVHQAHAQSPLQQAPAHRHNCGTLAILLRTRMEASRMFMLCSPLHDIAA